MAAVKNMTSLAVIVVTCETPELTQASVAALYAHTPAPFHLVVVDNGVRRTFADEARRLGAERSDFTYIANERNEGLAYALNQGLAATGAATIALLHGDVLVTPRWLDRVLDAFAADPALVVAAPAEEPCYGMETVRYVPRLESACIVVRRQVVMRIGGFDTRFAFAGSELRDFCLRARRAGGTVAIVARAQVERRHGGTMAALGLEPRRIADENFSLYTEKWQLGDDPATQLQREAQAATRPFDPRTDRVPFRYDNIFYPEAEPLALDTDKPVRFLCVPSWLNPGWHDTMRTLVTTFRANDPVSIVVRVEPPSEILIPYVQAQLSKLMEQAGIPVEAGPEIMLEATRLPSESLSALYTCVSAYVPCGGRREPFYQREAEACGTPVVPATPEALRAVVAELCPEGVEPETVVAAAPAPADSGWRPLVTAMVSTYRSERFIRGCLEDLVAQTLFEQGELEIVVIDSGSPENEAAVVGEYQARHNRPEREAIRYLRTERETLYASWNRAITVARGRYLTNANTDDRHRRDALEILARRLEETPDAAGAYADQYITRKPNDEFHLTLASLRFTWPEWNADAVASGTMLLGPQPMWRRSLHDRYGAFDPKYVSAGDYEFWVRIARTERFVKVPEVLGLYYLNEGGVELSSGRGEDESREIRRRYGLPESAAPARPLPASPGPAVGAH